MRDLYVLHTEVTGNTRETCTSILTEFRQVFALGLGSIRIRECVIFQNTWTQRHPNKRHQELVKFAWNIRSAIKQQCRRLTAKLRYERYVTSKQASYDERLLISSFSKR